MTRTVRRGLGSESHFIEQNACNVTMPTLADKLGLGPRGFEPRRRRDLPRRITRKTWIARRATCRVPRLTILRMSRLQIIGFHGFHGFHGSLLSRSQR